jgi:hypothetical protein
MSDEQRLNALERFRKDPGRLILEQHGHCEVPAGCGGVVLRWRMPGAARSMILYCYSSAPASWLLDGTELSHSRVDLVPDRHVLACCLSSVDPSAVLIQFAAVADRLAGTRHTSNQPEQQPLKVLSAADGTWKFSLNPPPDWMQAPFDASSWPALMEAPTPTFTRNELGAFQSQRCTRLGAVCLRLPGQGGAQAASPTGSVWIRKVFEVPEE